MLHGITWPFCYDLEWLWRSWNSITHHIPFLHSLYPTWSGYCGGSPTAVQFRPGNPALCGSCPLAPLLTCKNCRPYNLYCVSGNAKPCSINHPILLYTRGLALCYAGYVLYLFSVYYFVFVCVFCCLIFFRFSFVAFPSVIWYFWLGFWPVKTVSHITYTVLAGT